MRAHLGIAPIAWSNDDLPQLGGDTPLETCLSEARKAGFCGIESGGKFPKDAQSLTAVLQAHDIRLCGGWYCGGLLENDLSTEKRNVAAQMEMFKATSAPCLVYGEMTDTIQNKQDRPLNSRRRLSTEEMRQYGDRLTAFAEWCEAQAMPIVFHHHMGTVIETAEDIAALAEHSGDNLGFACDSGHLAFAGSASDKDVLEFIKLYGHRIRHFHAKDIRRQVEATINRDTTSFLDAVLQGIFTVPGDGDLDFQAIVKALAASGYEGWFVVEAEQDPADHPPYEYACIGRQTLAKALTNAGYNITEV